VTELVLFDLDGTLVDHRSAVLSAIRQIVQGAENAALPADELVELWRELERRHMREYLARDCSFAEQRRRRLRSFLPVLGEPVPDDTGLNAWFAEHYLAAFEAAWSTYPDVMPCLNVLQDLPAAPRRAVLTNGDPDQQRAKLARFGLLSYFEVVLTPTELGVAKPDPAAFTAACRHLGVEPRDALNVGDWLEGDVVAATQAGVTGIWLDRGVDPITGRPTEEPTTSDPELVRIEHLTNLIEFL
jgi:putative hydrolase of the HAD superfamily